MDGNPAFIPSVQFPHSQEEIKDVHLRLGHIQANFHIAAKSCHLPHPRCRCWAASAPTKPGRGHKGPMRTDNRCVYSRPAGQAAASLLGLLRFAYRWPVRLQGRLLPQPPQPARALADRPAAPLEVRSALPAAQPERGLILPTLNSQSFKGLL